MRILLNGETLELTEPLSLAALVDREKLANAACATEVNKKLVPKRDRSELVLKDGDHVEIVTLVGGG